MDFSVIFQLRTKKFWWMDVIFYFMISLLIATVLCWLIFLTKNSFQREDIKKEIAALQTVGTDQQKEQEENVIDYRNKINDFTELFKNHEFASNAFVFMQAQTMPNIWFKQFGLDRKNSGLQLSGESDNMDAFSRQVAAFEKNKYVKSTGTLNSSLGESARIGFNINLALDQNIFSYLSDITPILQTTPPGQLLVQQGQTPPNSLPAQAGPPAQAGTTTNPSTSSQQVSQSPRGTPSSEKLITSFHLLLNPEVAGLVDETNYTVTIDVPYGTDVKNLTSSIVISPGATVLPASHISQDFTNTVIYRVTAQDGSVQNYGVRVVVGAPPEVVVKKPNQSRLITLIVLVSVGIIIAAAAVIFFFLRKRSKKQGIGANKI